MPVDKRDWWAWVVGGRVARLCATRPTADPTDLTDAALCSADAPHDRPPRPPRRPRSPADASMGPRSRQRRPRPHRHRRRLIAQPVPGRRAQHPSPAQIQPVAAPLRGVAMRAPETTPSPEEDPYACRRRAPPPCRGSPPTRSWARLKLGLMTSGSGAGRAPSRGGRSRVRSEVDELRDHDRFRFGNRLNGWVEVRGRPGRRPRVRRPIGSGHGGDDRASRPRWWWPHRR